jgi:hypothetical protein
VGEIRPIHNSKEYTFMAKTRVVCFRTAAIRGTLFILVALGCASTARAQGFFVTGNVGYGLPAGSQYLGMNHDSNIRLHEGVYGSHGEALRFGGSLGYMFSKHVGMEVGGIFLPGKTFEMNDVAAKRTYKATGSGIMVFPTFMVSAGEGNVVPYARLGAAIGLVKVKNEDNTNTTGNVSSFVTEETGGTAIGYVGGLGIIFAASTNLGFFIEGSLVNMSYSPGKEEAIEYTVNGQNQLATVNPKSRDFKDSYTATGTNDPTLGVRRPFGSFSLIAGIRFFIPS